MKYLIAIALTLLVFNFSLYSQDYYWQQRVEYVMDIDMYVDSNQFLGEQSIKYFNNSPDTLTHVYYHLYFNAFQPGSMMDMRSRILEDPDRRIRDRIYHLKEDEMGWHKITSLKQDGKELQHEVSGTILEVQLDQPLLPGKQATFDMKFESQVPIQIRRSGRDNLEGIRYSMSQWYPKLAEYDQSGWQTHPYIHREFYAPWGDYEVNITIDKEYVVASTGILQNANSIGHGYSDLEQKKIKTKKGKLTWKFKAENIHDFVWAADPDFEHDIVETKNGPKVHYFYQSDTLVENWKRLPEYVDMAYDWLNSTYGHYPYSDYSIIQGGDGGTEYPMATLITSYRKLGSLVGTSVHEICHNWLPMLAGVNESYLAWIDEGFADYAGKTVMNVLFPNPDKMKIFERTYGAYYGYALSGEEEPLSTHADHFVNSRGYYAASYSKGAITYLQLAYIMGTKKMHKALNNYFTEWKFKHPSKNDFIRAFEKESNLELDWYFDFWTNSTQTIDYAIKSVYGEDGNFKILLEKVGEMPMPLEIEIESTSGVKTTYYIPLDVMRGVKEFDEKINVIQLSDWPYSNPYYEFTVPQSLSSVKQIIIDPSRRVADVDPSNNGYPFDSTLKFEGQ